MEPRRTYHRDTRTFVRVCSPEPGNLFRPKRHRGEWFNKFRLCRGSAQRLPIIYRSPPLLPSSLSPSIWLQHLRRYYFNYTNQSIVIARQSRYVNLSVIIFPAKPRSMWKSHRSNNQMHFSENILIPRRIFRTIIRIICFESNTRSHTHRAIGK